MRIFTDEKTGGESDEDSGGKGLYADFYKRGGIFHSAGNEIADRFADLLNPATGFSAYAPSRRIPAVQHASSGNSIVRPIQSIRFTVFMITAVFCKSEFFENRFSHTKNVNFHKTFCKKVLHIYIYIRIKKKYSRCSGKSREGKHEKTFL